MFSYRHDFVMQLLRLSCYSAPDTSILEIFDSSACTISVKYKPKFSHFIQLCVLSIINVNDRSNILCTFMMFYDHLDHVSYR
jgi:hypothetical protein